ncbi:MAG: acyl-CoA dehydrogenase family protein [Acidimicrobiales bacterium]
MDFTLTDEQQLLRDTARALLARECPPSRVRAHSEDRSALEPLWSSLADWTDLADGPLTDLCLFLEETGAVLAPGPFLATTALYRPLGGSGVGTVALAGADGVWMPNATMLAKEAVRTWVLDADVVETVAVVLPGPALAFVDRTALTLEPAPLLDSTRRAFTLALPPGLDGSPLAGELLDRVLQRATVALAAELLGCARWMLATTLQYAKDRVQFDRPIGSFQAIKHKLADMSLAWERAWAAVYAAAMAHDAGDPDRVAATHAAKAAAGEAATMLAKEAVQIHGGIGFTWEHDLHLYLRRAYTAEALLGGTAWHHDRLADILLGV